MWSAYIRLCADCGVHASTLVVLYIFDLLFQIKEEIEFDNLAKMYLKEKIKAECWDSLEVKGRSILVSQLLFRKLFFRSYWPAVSQGLV